MGFMVRVGDDELKENRGEKILLGIGWLSVAGAFISSSVFLGIIAVCIGAVLRMDYEENRHGLYLIVMGIISGLSGPILGTLLIWYMDNHF